MLWDQKLFPSVSHQPNGVFRALADKCPYFIGIQTLCVCLQDGVDQRKVVGMELHSLVWRPSLAVLEPHNSDYAPPETDLGILTLAHVTPTQKMSLNY